MDRVKPKDLALVRRLLELDKPGFGIADLEKLLGRRRPGLYVTLHRLVRYGVLTRLGRGLYQTTLKAPDLARVANALVYPSYLSFESALARHGILSQVPLALTFATPRRSRRLTLAGTLVEFHRLKPDLFFGYATTDGVYVAEPEKALLDQLYLVSRGRAPGRERARPLPPRPGATAGVREAVPAPGPGRDATAPATPQPARRPPQRRTPSVEGAASRAAREGGLEEPPQHDPEDPGVAEGSEDQLAVPG